MSTPYTWVWIPNPPFWPCRGSTSDADRSAGTVRRSRREPSAHARAKRPHLSLDRRQPGVTTLTDDSTRCPTGTGFHLVNHTQL